jgi:hypothetical protein
MNQSSSTVSAGTILAAPVNIVKHVDVGTQTETIASKFTRAFSVMGAHSGPRRKTMDEVSLTNF